MSKTYNRKQLDALQGRLNNKIDSYLSILAKSEREAPEEAMGSVQAALKPLQQHRHKLDDLVQTTEESGAVLRK